MFDQYDILLSPVLAAPPVKIGEIDMNTNDMKSYIERLSKYSPLQEYSINLDNRQCLFLYIDPKPIFR